MRSTLVLLAVAVTAYQLRAQSSAPAPADSLIYIGAAPALVGDGVISASWSEFGAAVLPNGQSMFFTITDGVFSRMTIVTSAQTNGRWGKPRVASFSGEWNDGDPSVSPDGRRMFYISNRPISGTEPRADFDIWFVERQGGGRWSEPQHAGAAVNDSNNVSYPTVSSDGSLYFQKGTAVWRARPRADSGYESAERVVLGDGQMRVTAPAIHPNGNVLFVIGSGATPRDLGDLFVSFRRGDSWSQPKRVAPPVNSPFPETAPTVSADGRTLYFSSDRVTRSAATWPRPKRVTTIEHVIAELQSVTLNGLRNIYAVDISALAQAQE